MVIKSHYKVVEIIKNYFKITLLFFIDSEYFISRDLSQRNSGRTINDSGRTIND